MVLLSRAPELSPSVSKVHVGGACTQHYGWGARFETGSDVSLLSRLEKRVSRLCSKKLCKQRQTDGAPKDKFTLWPQRLASCKFREDTRSRKAHPKLCSFPSSLQDHTSHCCVLLELTALHKIQVAKHWSANLASRGPLREQLETHARHAPAIYRRRARLQISTVYSVVTHTQQWED
eukprot:4826630-Amphidinium_carterae.1